MGIKGSVQLFSRAGDDIFDSCINSRRILTPSNPPPPTPPPSHSEFFPETEGVWVGSDFIIVKAQVCTNTDTRGVLKLLSLLHPLSLSLSTSLSLAPVLAEMMTVCFMSDGCLCVCASVHWYYSYFATLCMGRCQKLAWERFLFLCCI